MLMKPILLLLLSILLSACQTMVNQQSLYLQLGGEKGVELIAERFVKRVITDPRTEKHFEETNLDRLFEKLAEQLCEVSDGPCEYTGDDMKTVHEGMNISEREFNIVVEIMQLALDDAQVGLSAQNQLLARLATMRADMLYR